MKSKSSGSGLAPDPEALPRGAGKSRINRDQQVKKNDHERRQDDRPAQIPRIEFAELKNPFPT
jgi:hypothetical protein